MDAGGQLSCSKKDKHGRIKSKDKKAMSKDKKKKEIVAQNPSRD